MRIHGVTPSDCYTALQRAREQVGDSVYLQTTRHGSRSHGFATELILRADDPEDRPDGRRRRSPNNGGRFASEDDYAASYDEWGWILAHLYAIVPDALCGSARYPVYRSEDDYHEKTENKFHLDNPNPYDPRDPETAEKIVRNPERFSRAIVKRAKATLAPKPPLGDKAALNRIARFVNRPGEVNGGDLVDEVSRVLQLTGRAIVDWDEVADELTENAIDDVADVLIEDGPEAAIRFIDEQLAIIGTIENGAREQVRTDPDPNQRGNYEVARDEIRSRLS